MSVVFEIGKHTDCLTWFEADDQVGSSCFDHWRIEIITHTKMTEYTTTTLSHTDGLGTHDRNIFTHSCCGKKFGSEDGSLTADAAQDNVFLIIHVFYLL